MLVEFAACGLCHSDDHLATGDMMLGHLPYCGGHEGAGVVLEVGPGVRSLAVGDHIVTSFIPGCGKCRWCASGQQNLCDCGALLMTGSQMDGTYRMHIGEIDVGQGSLLSAFARHSILPEWSCIRIDRDIPLLTAALVGCAVPTGGGLRSTWPRWVLPTSSSSWGSAGWGSTPCKAQPTPARHMSWRSIRSPSSATPC